MKEKLREVTEQELKKIVLQETVFPTQFEDLQEKVQSLGVETRLLGLMCLEMSNRRSLKESPGYFFQASGNNPHQMALPDFEAENRHEVATRELVEFLREIPDPSPCH